MLALLLGGLLTTALVGVVTASTGAWKVQQELAAMQESTRLAVRALQDASAGAGFSPEPWDAASMAAAVDDASADDALPGGDRLVLTTRSERDCFGRMNPATGPTGAPRFDLLRRTFFARSDGNLVTRCEYGPDNASLVAQINNQGLAEHVEAFQVLFAEDTNADGHADRWVGAGQWQDENRLRGVRFALLLASPGPLMEPLATVHVLLNRTVTAPADGRLRRVFQGVAAFEGRS
jgi:hypothetical protein